MATTLVYDNTDDSAAESHLTGGSPTLPIVIPQISDAADIVIAFESMWRGDPGVSAVGLGGYISNINSRLKNVESATQPSTSTQAVSVTMTPQADKFLLKSPTDATSKARFTIPNTASTTFVYTLPSPFTGSSDEIVTLTSTQTNPIQNKTLSAPIITNPVVTGGTFSSPSLTGTPVAPTAAVDTNTTQLATTAFVIGQGYLKSATAASTYQPLDLDLTAIAALAGTSGLARKTAANTWSLDTNTYLTANQTITLSGDASGSGTTAITVTVNDDSHSHTGTTISALDVTDITTGILPIARGGTGRDTVGAASEILVSNGTGLVFTNAPSFNGFVQANAGLKVTGDLTVTGNYVVNGTTEYASADIATGTVTTSGYTKLDEFLTYSATPGVTFYHGAEYLVTVSDAANAVGRTVYKLLVSAWGTGAANQSAVVIYGEVPVYTGVTPVSATFDVVSDDVHVELYVTPSVNSKVTFFRTSTKEKVPTP